MQAIDETARLLLNRAGHAARDVEIAPLAAGGYVNDLYRLVAGRRPWVMKAYGWPWPTRPPAHRALVEFRSTNALCRAGLPVVPVAAMCGPDSSDHADVPEAALFEFVTGTVLPDSAVFDREHLFEIGRDLRRIHDAGVEKDVFAPPLAMRGTWESWTSWLEETVLAQTCQAAYPAVARFDRHALSGELSALLDQLRRLDRAATVHHDFHPWNVIITPSDRPRILDWEMVRYGDPCWDVATFLALWKRRLPTAALAGFVAGYGPIDWARVEIYIIFIAVWMAAEYAAGDRSAVIASALGFQLLGRQAGGESLIAALHRCREDLPAVRS